MLELQDPAFNEPDLRTLCAPYLRLLHEAAQETVRLCVRAGDNIVIVDGLEAPGRLASRAGLGAMFPLHVSPASRVILSSLADDEIRDYITRNSPLRAYTPASITDPRRLWEDIQLTRNQGYAFGYADGSIGVASVAFPILDAAGQLHGSVVIAGPETRFRPRPAGLDAGVPAHYGRPERANATLLRQSSHGRAPLIDECFTTVCQRRSALHVFEILRLVSRTDTPPGVADISGRLDLPTSTVHRALATLEQSQYLSRLESAPRYKLGPMPQFLTRAIFRRFALRSASLPFLRRIAEDTGETASLTVRVGYYQMRINVAYGGQDLYSPGRLGEIRLLHQGLAGLGILMTLTESDLKNYRSFVADHHPKEQRLLAAKNLQDQLRRSREVGYVAEPLDHVPGYFTLAMPLRNAQGAGIAAVVVTSPVTEKAGRVNRPTWARHVIALEELIRSDPVAYENPYAHLDPGSIIVNE